jgi:hypothetical protein
LDFWAGNELRPLFRAPWYDLSTAVDPGAFVTDRRIALLIETTHASAREKLRGVLAFIRELDEASFEMLVRTYFHIVENTVRASTEQHH